MILVRHSCPVSNSLSLYKILKQKIVIKLYKEIKQHPYKQIFGLSPAYLVCVDIYQKMSTFMSFTLYTDKLSLYLDFSEIELNYGKNILKYNQNEKRKMITPKM